MADAQTALRAAGKEKRDRMVDAPKDEAASTVQRAFRCFRSRDLYFELWGLRTSALTIQGAYRGHLARKLTARHVTARAAPPLPCPPLTRYRDVLGTGRRRTIKPHTVQHNKPRAPSWRSP